MKLQNYKDATLELQRKIAKLPQVEPETNHYFADGVYMREMKQLGGTVVIGKTHKTEHLNTLSEGECMVAMGGMKAVLKAPYTFVSPVGSKKVIIALTDITWSTIHHTVETDLDKLEALLVEEEPDQLTNEGKEALWHSTT